MRDLKVFLKKILLIVVLSVSCACLIAFVKWQWEGQREDYYTLSRRLISDSMIIIGILIVVVAGYFALENFNDYRLEMFLNKHGYTEEYYRRLRKKADRKRGSKKVDAMLVLATELSSGGYFDEAVQTMKNIELKYVSRDMLGEYYNAYMYILVVNGDVKNAEIAYNAGSEYIEKNSKRRIYAGMVYHTLGIYEYAKGNYTQAEEHFNMAVKKAVTQFTENAAMMFLGLVYLKTDRVQLARSAAARVARYVINPRQKQDLEKLMKLVERRLVFKTGNEENEQNEENEYYEDLTEKGESSGEISQEGESVDYAGRID